MAVFRYQALDGNQRLITDEVEADSVQQAIAQLEATGLAIQSIGYADAPTDSATPKASNTQAPAETIVRGVPRSAVDIEQAVLHAHMAQILERSRAIAPALRAYSEEMPAGSRRRQLRTVCKVLEQGDATAATAELIALPDYWIPLLSAATSSADPGRVLNDFLSETERTDNLRRQRWQTLAYPFLVGCMALAVMTLLSIFVISEFRKIFDDFGLQLPGLTQLLLKLASWLASPWLLVILAPALVVGVSLLTDQLLNNSFLISWLPDRFSAFGRRNAIARFAQFTADLLEAGLSRPDALRIAGFTVHRNRLRRAAWCLANDMDSGGDYAPQNEPTPLTATVVRAVRYDMPSQSRIRLLREISACHAERARRAFSWTTGLVEPFAICVVGFVVGMTVMALFLPLVKLVEGLSH